MRYCSMLYTKRLHRYSLTMWPFGSALVMLWDFHWVHMYENYNSYCLLSPFPTCAYLFHGSPLASCNPPAPSIKLFPSTKIYLISFAGSEWFPDDFGQQWRAFLHWTFNWDIPWLSSIRCHSSISLWTSALWGSWRVATSTNVELVFKCRWAEFFASSHCTWSPSVRK